MAAPPGQLLALQDFNALKVMHSVYDKNFLYISNVLMF